MGVAARALDRRPTRLPYRPELDGVRAVAVLAVLGFHLPFVASAMLSVAGGGFLGVDVFFVLSGMLISQLLLAEWDSTGDLGLRTFYARRARRLLPALAVLIVAYCAFTAVAHHDLRANLKGLVSELSYETYGHAIAAYPAAISHTWTLVVEWEFYLVWPLAMGLLLRRGGRPLLFATTIALAGADVLARAVTYGHTHNFVLGYHLAALRVDELLIGSALGQLTRPVRVPALLRWAGAAGILVAFSRARYPQSWLYFGGMTLLALATAAVVAPSPRRWWGHHVLGWPPLVWVGRISYSLYLWSVPTIVEVGRYTGGWPGAARAVFAIALSVALAAGSYYVVEQRYRRPSRRALHPAQEEGQTVAATGPASG